MGPMIKKVYGNLESLRDVDSCSTDAMRVDALRARDCLELLIQIGDGADRDRGDIAALTLQQQRRLLNESKYLRSSQYRIYTNKQTRDRERFTSMKSTQSSASESVKMSSVLGNSVCGSVADARNRFKRS